MVPVEERLNLPMKLTTEKEKSALSGLYNCLGDRLHFPPSNTNTDSNDGIRLTDLYWHHPNTYYAIDIDNPDYRWLVVDFTSENNHLPLLYPSESVNAATQAVSSLSRSDTPVATRYI